MPNAASCFLSEGWDMYSGSFGPLVRWGNNSSGPGLTPGRFGGQALDISNTGNYYNVFLNMPTVTAATLGMAVDIFTQKFTPPNYLFGFGFNSYLTNQTWIQYNWTTGQASIVCGGTVQASSAMGACPASNWHYFELSVTFAASGSAALYFDGVQVCSCSGVNTQPNGTGSNLIVIGQGNAGNNTNYGYYDDVYMNPSATPLGPMKIVTIRPASNGTVAWTPLTGSNFSEVNATTVLAADTAYVSAGPTGTSDLYNMAAVGSTPGQIFSVGPVCFARSTDANPRGLDLQIQSGATNEQGSMIVYGGTSYVRGQRYSLNDPNTGLPWTNTALAALQAGPYLAQ